MQVWRMEDHKGVVNFPSPYELRHPLVVLSNLWRQYRDGWLLSAIRIPWLDFSMEHNYNHYIVIETLSHNMRQ
jgi:hypothetical protein